MQLYSAQVTKKNFLTPEVVELEVKLLKPRLIHFKAGQFVFFNIGGAFKAYSMTSPPSEKAALRFLVKLIPNGRGSKFIKNLQIGDSLEFTGPEGNFILKTKRDVCALAAGIGIAPYLSMLPVWLKKNPKAKMSIIYGVKSEAEILYQSELALLAKKFPGFEIILLTGQRVTDYLDIHFQEFVGRIFFICGKPAAVRDLENLLAQKGVAEEKVFIENFLA